MPDTKIFPIPQYDALVKQTFDKIVELGIKKGGEYAGDIDRLANFRRNASRLGLDYRAIWAVYASKHWDALMQYVSDINQGIKRERLEGLEGRVDDLIVYLLLFKAMLDENSIRAFNPEEKK